MVNCVYIDMDGVLVDFMGRCLEKNVFDARGKIDWNAVNEIGPDFWATMSWLPGSQNFLRIIGTECRNRGIEYGILSAIQFRYGEIGKRLWCTWNTDIDNDHVIIVPHGAPKSTNGGQIDKSAYSKPGRLLIDDNSDNIEAWKRRGGETILFANPEQALNEFMQIVETGD